MSEREYNLKRDMKLAITEIGRDIMFWKVSLGGGSGYRIEIQNDTLLQVRWNIDSAFFITYTMNSAHIVQTAEFTAPHRYYAAFKGFLDDLLFKFKNSVSEYDIYYNDDYNILLQNYEKSPLLKADPHKAIELYVLKKSIIY